MMDDVTNAVGIIGILLIFIFIISTVFHLIVGPTENYTEKLNTCAKQHNVYECELIAVPKEGVGHD